MGRERVDRKAAPSFHKTVPGLLRREGVAPSIETDTTGSAGRMTMGVPYPRGSVFLVPAFERVGLDLLSPSPLTIDRSVSYSLHPRVLIRLYTGILYSE